MRPNVPSVLLAGASCLLALALPACGRGTAPAERPNVVLITVDSLRADRPGFMGGKVETPSMDSLAASGIVFTEAITTTPQTLPSLASLHTGLYPPAHGVRDDGRSRIPDPKRTLAEAFEKAGYRTAAFAGALALHEKYGLDRGFETYAEAFAEAMRPSVMPDLGVPATRIADRAIEWLGAAEPGRAFFLWVNFYDPHYFYEPPEPFRETYSAQPYDGEVAFVDREMGRILRWLSDHGRDADTIVVLAGNHGEGLGEGGEQYHGILLRQATLRVPLVVRLPGPASGSRVADPVSLVDVAPTVMDLAGLGPSAAEGMQGVSLAGYARAGATPDPARAIYFETMMPKTLLGWAPQRGIRAGSLKYVEAPGTGWAGLFDLAADPEEASSLAVSRSEDARRLASEAARIGGTMEAGPDSLPGDLADEIRSIGLKPETPSITPIIPVSMLDTGNAALQGHRTWQRRAPTTALFILQDVLKKDPDNYIALLDLAGIGMTMRQFATAQEHLRRAQERYPGDAEVYHTLGHFQIIVARSPDDLQKARVLFTTAARLAPLNEEALYDSACGMAAIDQDRALDYLEAAIRNGFRDWRHMSRDRDLDPIRGTDRFAEITGGRAAAPEEPSAPAPEASSED